MNNNSNPFSNESVISAFVEFNKDKEDTITIDSDDFRKLFLQSLSEKIMDKTTIEQAQIFDLHKAIDNTTTAVGSSYLLRSLAQPNYSPEFLSAKQDSVREIASNSLLRQSLEDYLTEISKREKHLFKLIGERFAPADMYFVVSKARKAGKKIHLAAKSIPQPESPYLSLLIDTLKGFRTQPAGELFRGPIYQTFGGIKSKSERKWYTPRLRWGPRRFTALTMAALSPIPLSMTGLINIEGKGWAQIAAMITMMPMMYVGLMKPVVDTMIFASPLAKRLSRDKSLHNATDAIGGIDELTSFVKYGEKFPRYASLPNLSDGPVHYFSAKDIRNPILSTEESIESFVPNDVHLNGSHVTIITGPNSGGKTTYCKSVVQNQILAQVGCYVLSTEAAINLADSISYQYYMPDRLQSSEGDFGVNMRRTKDIFMSTTPKSLVVMNTLASGTTFEEEMTHSNYVMRGFHDIGNNTLLVTHNHALAEELKRQNIGQYLQVEFNGDGPTHRLAPGISTVSHADVIAKKIAFAEDDVHKYLVDKGYRK